MQTQSDSGNDKATRTQERKASITPQPFMLFDPFSAKHITNTVVYLLSKVVTLLSLLFSSINVAVFFQIVTRIYNFRAEICGTGSRSEVAY